ncbi:hypothetical protein BKA70DRAFT_1521580 [Coprinopsis sp. MPI-PUGE-AT-0042]|nr:hypothetical protein BKA70DRAFT_1521580 [Coprinopsis sp. MPI-PUGE-AT-0042]
MSSALRVVGYLSWHRAGDRLLPSPPVTGVDLALSEIAIDGTGRGLAKILDDSRCFLQHPDHHLRPPFATTHTPGPAKVSRMADVPHASARQQVLEGLVGADILPLVFERLYDEALLSAALTCKAFSTPALDILWREMDRLDPLVPLFVPAENEVIDSNGKVKISRFDLYRKRIRIFYLGHAPCLNPDIASREAKIMAALHLCHLMPGEKLLPNLTELRMYVSRNSKADALIPFLLTRSLRLISLRGKTPPPDQLFSLVATLSPALEHLALEFRLEALAESATNTFPVEYLSSLRHLRSLLITVTDSPEGRHSLKVSSIRHLLQHLPRLCHILISSDHIEYDWLSPVGKDLIAAPLQSFKIIYYPNRENGLQPFHSFPFITELHLSVNPLIFTPLEVALFIQAVASHPRLLQFSMNGGPINHLALDVGDVLPLFSSRTLHCITFGNCLDIIRHVDRQAPESSIPQTGIIDLVIEEVKQHHGPLEQLFLNNSIHPMPTFDALMKFASYVPWLRVLTIGVWATPEWMSHNLQTCSQMQFESSLQQLEICNTSEQFSGDDSVLLAKCIDAWFPNLVHVYCWRELGTSSPMDKLRAEWKDKRLRLAMRTLIACDTGA